MMDNITTPTSTDASVLRYAGKATSVRDDFCTWAFVRDNAEENYFNSAYLSDVFSTNKGDNMFFRLYTLGLSSVSSAPVFNILFFFTFAVLEIVSVAAKILCLWGVVEVSFHGRVEYVF